MTFLIAEQGPSALTNALAEAKLKGEARIRTESGEEFLLRPAPKSKPWHELPALNLNLTTEEIVAIVREGREREYPWMRSEPTPSDGEQDGAKP